jgi:hypothetical protein
MFMNLKAFTGGALAIAMLSTSVAATAAPVASSTVRVGSVSKDKSEVAGGGVIAALLLAGVAAIGVIAIVNDSNDDDSDSN